MVAGFDFGRPGVVFGAVFAGDVVWVGGLGFVGEDAFLEEFVEVVAGYGGGYEEEDAERQSVYTHICIYLCVCVRRVGEVVVQELTR